MNKPHLREEHRCFIRYLLVGGWNTVFGMTAYAGLYRWLGNSVHYLVLLVPSNILAITNARESILKP